MPQTPERLVLRPPPQRPESQGAAGAVLNAVPMLGSLGSIVLVSSMGGENRARGLVAAGMILFATVGFVVVQVDRQRSQGARRVTGSRAAYLRHLERVRAAARAAARQQRTELTGRHPDPSALPALAGERSRLWPGDTGGPATLLVRYGACPQPLSLELVPPDEDAAGSSGAAAERDGPVDPAAAAALARLLAVHRVAPDLPATLDLRTFGRIELCGEADATRSLARALVCSATSGHGPDRLAVAVLCGRAALQHWDWVKWLPHGRSSHARDAVGPSWLVATDPDDLAALLGEDQGTARAHLLLVVDGPDPPPAGHLLSADGPHRPTVLELPAAWDPLEEPGRLRLELTRQRRPGDRREAVLVLRAGEDPGTALADRCGLATAEAFARRLAPLAPRAPARTAEGNRSAAPDAADLLGLGDLRTLDPAERWAARTETERLRVPIGVSEDGATVHLDLKEAAQRGMGPHGLLIGATGSGKSELLRTLVLGLALTHSPEELALVLVDFKGGATFSGLGELPHVSAVITNLETELALVDRMQDALHGEVVRRQEALRAAGHASVRDYERARAAGATGAGGVGLDPLPSLVIIVDEFAEMLAAKPEFIDLFVAIGRVGRSLGLHLLLASQRLDEGRLRGLESHLSYRIGLRTFSSGESRTVLGVPDAAALPSTPGVGYLRPEPATLVRFRAAYVSAEPPPVAAAPPGPREPAGILPFSVVAVAAAGPTVESPLPHDPGRDRALARNRGRSVLDLAVGRLARSAPPTRRIWLPPLGLPDTLAALMPDLAVDPALGLVSAGWRDRGPSWCRWARSTGRGRSVARRSSSTCATLAGTSPWWARPAAASPPCWRPSWPAWRSPRPRWKRRRSCSTSAAEPSRPSPTCRTWPASPRAPNRTRSAASSPRPRGS